MIPDKIREIAEKYLTGIATPEEVQQLHDWYDSEEEGNTELVITREPITMQQYGENSLAQLMAAIRQEKQDQAAPHSNKLPVVKRFTAWWGITAAAAILIAIIITGYLYFRSPSDNNTGLANTEDMPAMEIKPGGNVAVLTLADGTSIALDSLNTHALPPQGNTELLRPADGQLIYTAPPDAEKAVMFNTLRTPNGGQYQLTLPDGTRVWLNAASSLRYPTAFIGSSRTVELLGEGYFEVTTNAAQPFIVSTPSAMVTVLGTHFNINAYSNEQVSRTTLLEGRVQVGAFGETVMLKPGQQAGIPQQPGEIQITQADINQVMAWKNGYFAFEHTDLKTLMRQIARWYDVEILYEQEPGDARFVGEVSRNTNLSEVLKILELSGVHFRIDGKRIIVTP